MAEETNVFVKIAGKIGGSSVFLAAAIMIFGGGSGAAIGGVAILCGFGVLMALFNLKRSSGCTCQNCSCEYCTDKSKTELTSSKKSKKKK